MNTKAPQIQNQTGNSEPFRPYEDQNEMIKNYSASLAQTDKLMSGLLSIIELE